ncbi:TPA_asm: hypothetical protein HUJ06_031859 [Nelumbo nucifera]|uniref:Uncharacterized protein n=1 Tax=Nelumbo nucifera TaxID=4432 RepID=A0A822ZY07_NELNU|nr:TPA_asm: hypothetical protein HUJ06_025475 [Nelumbo nucifera]DAD49420.1 TPA_asm: hypothetical protein HUJ06_031859 [Nelumbo nucifera]
MRISATKLATTTPPTNMASSPNTSHSTPIPAPLNAFDLFQCAILAVAGGGNASVKLWDTATWKLLPKERRNRKKVVEE